MSKRIDMNLERKKALPVILEAAEAHLRELKKTTSGRSVSSLEKALSAFK